MSLRRFTPTRWAALCQRLNACTAPPFERLRIAYAEPVRAYHTSQHIDECLAWFDTLEGKLNDPDITELALWLHDVVYNPRAKDNELRSADLAADWFAKLDIKRLDQLRRSILATQQHQPTPGDMDCQALLDIDLSILAAAPARFAEYGRQIRAEYAFVPWPIYWFKRRQFMHQLAGRKQLFFHPALAPILEPLARNNLA
jgi:predicted metal-dependent HD superfamily phosphohydrolase